MSNHDQNSMSSPPGVTASLLGFLLAQLLAANGLATACINAKPPLLFVYIARPCLSTLKILTDL